MQLELFDFETDKLVSSEADEIPLTFISECNKENISDEQLHRQLNNLSLSADQKALVAKIADFTVSTGKTIIRVGRRILEIAFLFFKKFPATSFGLVIGLVISYFIPPGVVNGFAIPFVSSILALIKKLAVLFALGLGFKEDMKNTALSNNIAKATSDIRNSLVA